MLVCPRGIMRRANKRTNGRRETQRQTKGPTPADTMANLAWITFHYDTQHEYPGATIFMLFSFSFSGITRLPVLEGEVSHVEIPRTSQNLGITIVGGADTPLVRLFCKCAPCYTVQRGATKSIFGHACRQMKVDSNKKDRHPYAQYLHIWEYLTRSKYFSVSYPAPQLEWLDWLTDCMVNGMTLVLTDRQKHERWIESLGSGAHEINESWT